MAQYSLYNDKTDSGYRYDPTPDFDRVEVLAFPGQRLLLRALVVRERPTLRVADSTATTGEESYEGARGELTLDWWLSDTWMAGLSTRQLREERAYSPTGEDDATAAQSQVLALRHTDVYTVLYLPGGDVLEAGLWGGRFANSIAALDDRQDYRHSLDSTAAYAFWQWFRSERLHWLFSLQAGEMQLYERRGEAPEKTKDERTPQVKLGAGLVLAQPGDYRFVFNSTWDLDILTDRAWDGGNIQVQLFF